MDSKSKGKKPIQMIKCRRCGNKNDFYEKMLIVQCNYFQQGENGCIDKVYVEQTNSPCYNSRLYCSNCDQEIDEDYHLFLDRYGDKLFSISS